MWAVLYKISNQSKIIHQRYERKGWAARACFLPTICGRFRKSCDVCWVSFCSCRCDKGLETNPKLLWCLVWTWWRICQRQKLTFWRAFSQDTGISLERNEDHCVSKLWKNACAKFEPDRDSFGRDMRKKVKLSKFRNGHFHAQTYRIWTKHTPKFLSSMIWWV
jgi:hypothetical protein